MTGLPRSSGRSSSSTDVQHGSGGIVDVDGADLAPAAVLFAHRSIIPAAGDIRPLR
jgi:hypothetical protein